MKAGDIVQLVNTDTSLYLPHKGYKVRLPKNSVGLVVKEHKGYATPAGDAVYPHGFMDKWYDVFFMGSNKLFQCRYDSIAKVTL